MYGMSAKRFEPDLYKEQKDLKKLDFILGFALAAFVCVALFKLWWFAGPLAVFCACMLGLKYKFPRRYIIYGALGLIFFPFLLWAGFSVFYYGRNELK
jgi:hypothetical protein